MSEEEQNDEYVYIKKYRRVFTHRLDKKRNIIAYIFGLISIPIFIFGIYMAIQGLSYYLSENNEVMPIVLIFLILICLGGIILFIGKAFDDLLEFIPKRIIRYFKRSFSTTELHTKTSKLCVSIYAIEALAESNPDNLIEILLEILKNSKFCFIRKKAASIIGEFKALNAIDPLIEQISIEKRNGMKFSLACHLAKIEGGKGKGIDIIESMLEKSQITEQQYDKYKELCRNIIKESERLNNEIELMKKIHNEDFWIDFINQKLDSEETKLFDFKETYALWRTKSTDNKEIMKFKREICLDIASFANSEGGVIVIGITDKRPRRIKGLEELERKKQSINSLITNFLEIQDFPYELIDVKLNNEDNIEVSCLLILISQTKEVVGVKENGKSFLYPYRLPSEKIYKNYNFIRRKKKDIEKNNYNFLNYMI